MARLVRAAIKAERWFTDTGIDWLPAGEVQADALMDLKTDNGVLSVFEVQDADEAERVIVAFAALRKKLEHVEYALFERAPVEALGISIVPNPAKTPDRAVNDLHRDLRELTATQLARLANVIGGGQTDLVILKKRLGELIKQGLGTNRLERKAIPDPLLTELR